MGTVTDMDAATTLAPELWMRIFDEVLEEGPTSVVVPLIMVCKPWKEISTPLLFRHISLTKESALETLARRFLTRVAYEDNPGRWTRSLRIHYSDSSKHYVSNILVLISSMPDLQVLHTCEPISSGELMAFAHTHGSSLQDLQIDLHYSLPLSLTFECLSRLKMLRRLAVNIDSSSNSVLTYSNERIDFPTLTHLRYRSRGSWHELGLAVLSHGNFPSLSDVELDLPNMTDCAPHIQQFFANLPSLQRLRTALPSQFTDEFLQLPIAVEQMEFACVPLADAVIQWLSPRVQSLSVQAALNDDSIDTFLDKLYRADTLSFREIRLILPERFTWASGGRSNAIAQFVGKMLHYSLLLQLKGIELVDEEGTTAKRIWK